MATPTYVPLGTVTLGSAANSVTFSSIPATYRDLIVVITGGASIASYAGLQFNSSTTDYSSVDARFEVNGVYSTAGSFGWIPQRYTATANNATIYQIFDYAQTDKHKTALVRSGAATSAVNMGVGRWAVTDAITSVRCQMEGARTWNTGSTFALYGIA